MKPDKIMVMAIIISFASLAVSFTAVVLKILRLE